MGKRKSSYTFEQLEQVFGQGGWDSQPCQPVLINSSGLYQELESDGSTMEEYSQEDWGNHSQELHCYQTGEQELGEGARLLWGGGCSQAFAVWGGKGRKLHCSVADVGENPRNALRCRDGDRSPAAPPGFFLGNYQRLRGRIKVIPNWGVLLVQLHPDPNRGKALGSPRPKL